MRRKPGFYRALFKARLLMQELFGLDEIFRQKNSKFFFDISKIKHGACIQSVLVRAGLDVEKFQEWLDG
jgi:hypothetical protein